jgi:predicted  nucleic acid-binding Zn-ribbon protein
LQNTLTTSNGNISQLQTDLTSLTSTVNTNTTDITTAEGNITTNTTNITTNASDISTLSNNLTTTNANVSQNATNITTLDTTVTSNTNAISSNDTDIATANTNITTNANAISTLQNDLNTAEADIVQNATNHTNLTSTVNSNTTSIHPNAGNITTANTNISTNASAISTLQNELNTAEADILQNASDVTSLTSTVNTNTSSIGTNSTNISNNASSISTLTNNLSTANTNITQNSSNITTLTTNVNTNTSDIGTNTTNISTNASNITTLTNDLNTAEADILSNAGDITSLTTTVNGNTGDISTNASSISTLNTGLTTANNNISANSTNITSVTSTANTNTGNISSNASSISSLTTTVNGHTTSISTNATSINGIEGRYGVTIDNNGALTGFQLLSGASTSSFVINANDFKIYTGGGNLTPFSVSGSTVLIDGQLQVSGTATIQGSSNTGDFIAAQFINSGSSGLTSVKVRNNAGYYGLYRLNTTVANDIGYYGIDIVMGPASGGGEHRLANFFNGGMSLGGGSNDKLIFNDNYAANTNSTAAGAIYVAGSSDGQNTQAMFITVPTNQSTSTPALNIETNGSNSIFKVFRNSHVETGTITTSGQIRGGSLTSDAGITASGAIATNNTIKGTRFIDHNDANYYLDPNSTSNLNAATFVGTISGQNQYLAQDLGIGFTSGNIGGKLDIVRSSAGIGIKNNYGTAASGTTGLLGYTSASMNTSGAYHLVFQAAPTSGSDTNMLLCDLNGNLRNRNNSYGQYSDENLKENITLATAKLEDVKQLQVKNFNFIGDELKQIGLIAQDVEQIFPGLVENIETPQGNQVKSLKYSVLVPILIKAIQELEARVAQLETP